MEGYDELFPWILNEGTKGDCDACGRQVRFTSGYRWEDYRRDHMNCRQVEIARSGFCPKHPQQPLKVVAGDFEDTVMCPMCRDEQPAVPF